MTTRLRISFSNLMSSMNYQSIWSFVLINLSASLVLCALATTIGDAFEIDRAETAGRLASIIWPLNLAFCFGASLVASAVWLLWEYMRAIMAVRWQARFAKVMPKFIRRIIALLGLILVGFLLIYIRDMFENYFANVITMIELLERASWTDVLSRIIFRWLVPTFAWLFLIGITLFPKMKESLFYSIGSRKIIYVTAITMFLSWAGTTIRVPVSSELVITSWNSVSIDPTALSEAVVNFEDQQGYINNSLFDSRVYEIAGNSFEDVNQFNFRSNYTFINKIKNQSSMISYSIVNNDQKSVKYTYQDMTEPENISFVSKDAYCDHHVILRFFSTPGFPVQMEKLPAVCVLRN